MFVEKCNNSILFEIKKKVVNNLMYLNIQVYWIVNNHVALVSRHSANIIKT